jgi:hypothetical protein
MKENQLPQYAGRVEMAKILGCSPRALDYWRKAGRVTKFHIHGANRVVFDVAATLKEIGLPPSSKAYFEDL